MTVDKAIHLAGKVESCALIVAATVFWIAAMVNGMGGSLATIALVGAASTLFIFVCVSAAMAYFVYRVLSRQPDEVSLTEKGSRPVYREHMDGAVLYEDTGTISGAALIIHPPDQTPPCVRCEPEGTNHASRKRALEMPVNLDVFEGSLKDSFDQNRSDGNE